jgi:hypothetical protein
MSLVYERCYDVNGNLMLVPQLDDMVEFEAWLEAEQDAAYAAGQTIGETTEISEGVGYVGI